MHLLNSARTRMTCVPFVHEVSAVVGVEYFNEMALREDAVRAFALVTAGPGITNSITGIAGAFLESRECLVIGGQVKSADLSRGKVRQRGIQEIDGVSIAAPVCKVARQIDSPIPMKELVPLVIEGRVDRRGPVFLEFCLDAQGAATSLTVEKKPSIADGASRPELEVTTATKLIHDLIQQSERPLLLIGGGVEYRVAAQLENEIASLPIPVQVTWNGVDRVTDDLPNFLGRPNTWGQRSANIILNEADLVVVLGSRLGIQQTGFNWTNWTKAQVVQVDIDQSELEKGHPRVDFPINTDANAVLAALTKKDFKRRDEWMEFCHSVRREVPIVDEANENHKEFMSPFELMTLLTEESRTKDVFIPASSGSGQFVPMETLQLRRGQRMFTNKGLASMGYGLAAAVGAALADRTRRVFLIEGDGSFSQNFQELGTVVAQSLNLKVLLLDNDGYASIRTTQRNYFGGVYLGCDAETGLGFPNWIKLAESFGIPVLTIAGEGIQEEHRSLLEQDGPAMFVVKVDPEQTYFPKVSSSLGQNGEMVSNPIHSMTPPLSAETMARISALRNW